MAPEYRTDSQVRDKLRDLIERGGFQRQYISRMLGKAPGYVHDFLERGTPRRLKVGDAARLARFVGVDAIELGVMPGQDEAA